MTQSSSRPLKILFVCIGNSCRSQMAEAYANQFGDGRVQAFSAGSHPLGMIAAETYEVMREKGFSLEGQSSKGVREVPVAEMDVVVGMGCEVACPVPTDFKGRVVEWHIPDPYGHNMETFRDVRDVIERQVVALLDELASPHSACT
jgi:arsenate reductase